MAAELGLDLHEEDDAPLYQQLFDQVAERVRTGAWPPGYRLPATRDLAQRLGVHRNTVVRAFEELTTSGLLISAVGRGTFVAPHAAASAPRSPSSEELPWQSLLSRAATSRPLERLNRFRREGLTAGAVNLVGMQPPSELLPHAQFRKCVDHVMRTLGPRALGYAPREGVLALREQIVRELAHAGVPAHTDDVLITTGSQQALDILARALVDRGDRFLVDGATYTGALNLLSLVGATVVGVPSDGDGPDVDWLRRLARGEVKGLYLMPNCHNPTGATIGTQRRRELVAWSHEAGVPLIEDDYGADLDLEGEPAPPYLRSLDSQVLYTSTFSKKLIPSLRVGFIVAPPALREQLRGLKHAMDLGTSALLQYALAEFLERGYLRAHLRRALPEYRRRRDALHEALLAELPDDVRWTLPKRGLTLWLELPAGIDPDDVHAAARRTGVAFSPAALHTTGGAMRPGIRLTYCNEPPERLVEGARRLGRAFAELYREKPRAPRAHQPLMGV